MAKSDDHRTDDGREPHADIGGAEGKHAQTHDVALPGGSLEQGEANRPAGLGEPERQSRDVAALESAIAR